METQAAYQTTNGAADSTTFLRPLADIYKDLGKPPAPRHLSEKNTGKFKATYMHHAVVRDYLDLYAPGWEWEEKLFDAAGKLYVVGRLTIVGSDGRVTREACGNEDDEVTGYGDASSNASAMALRRAAMAHGFCRSLWKK